MFSRFFIDRPIFAAVLSIFIVLAGLAAMRSLPIAQYPEIAPPVVTVQAIYPGASAEVIEQTVAAPIENAITGIEKMIFMSSTSGSNGIVQIQVRLTPNDLIRALNEQNAQFAAGKIGQSPSGGAQELVYTITTKGRLADPREFENIIVRANPDGSSLRLKDVARVELASKDYEFIGRLNGTQTTLIGVFLLPGANALKVAEDVVQTVDELQPRFPPAVVLCVPDRHAQLVH